MKGCKQCPAFAKCTVQYRGSGCAALRSTYGVETDPEIITNADRIRAMSDEELASYFLFFCPTTINRPKYTGITGEYTDEAETTIAKNLDWLRQPAKEEN